MDTLAHQLNLPAPGTYVVAVSGGVDSVALLHLLSRNMPDSQLIVAHFDHGIRPDSHLDRALVQELAASFGLPFENEEGRLGSAATEEQARAARYAFLRQVMARHQADAIITAHHAGDRLETAVLQSLRGAAGAGLLLGESPDLLRPLIGLPKHVIVLYADHHRLTWREDSTNTDRRLARNLIRHELLGDDVASPLQAHLDHLEHINDRLQSELDSWLAEHAAITSESITCEASSLRRLDATTIRYVYAAAIKQLDPHVQLSKSALDSLVMLTKTPGANWQKTVSSKLNAHLAYGTISLELNAGKQSVPDSLTLLPGSTVRYGSHRFALLPSADVHGSGLAVGAGSLTIRAPEPGDRIHLAAGNKKVQDLFTDAKIPRRQRPGWPVVVRGSQIIWLPGLASSHSLPQTADYFLTHEEL